jgi:hypothetical protein
MGVITQSMYGSYNTEYVWDCVVITGQLDRDRPISINIGMASAARRGIYNAEGNVPNLAGNERYIFSDWLWHCSKKAMLSMPSVS